MIMAARVRAGWIEAAGRPRPRPEAVEAEGE